MKRREEMNHYEVLNVETSASPQEIESAYLLGRSTYARDSMAHYGLLSEAERNAILERIELAYRTLRDPEKRDRYDRETLPDRLTCADRITIRKSTERMIFEDADRANGLFRKIKNLLWAKDSASGD